MTDQQRCRSCGAAIIWARTERGKSMPVDAEPPPFPGTGTIVLDHTTGALVAKVVMAGPGLRRPHFVTCPHADGWRRKR